MITRIWETGIAEGRMQDYLEFAQKISAPMFRMQKNILGFMILHSQNKSEVLTWWPDRQSIAEMQGNELYQQTVTKILDSGLLAGRQTVEIFETDMYELVQ